MGVFRRWITSKKGKTPYWYIRYTVNKKQKWESIGKAGEVTKSVAQAQLAERKKQIRLGTYGIMTTEIPTLFEYKDEYLAYKRDTLKNRSWTRDRLSLKHLNYSFGNYKLSEIKSGKIKDYQTKRINDGVRPATVNRELSCLKHLFNEAKRSNKFFGDNPVSSIKFLDENNEKTRVLSIEEENSLIQNCPDHIKLIVKSAIYTGMRKMEILSLRWSNVDIENKLITIEATNSKSKRIKYIPLSDHLVLELKKQKLITGFQEYVFLTPTSENYKRSDSLNSFVRACKKANLKDVTFHTLRHTFGSRGVEATGNIVAVGKILGHADLKTTMRYVHIDKSLRDIVNKISEFSK